MSETNEVTQDGPVLTVGRVTFDFGIGNIEEAWRVAQVLNSGRVRLLVDGEPA